MKEEEKEREKKETPEAKPRLRCFRLEHIDVQGRRKLKEMPTELFERNVDATLSTVSKPDWFLILNARPTAKIVSGRNTLPSNHQ